MPPHFEQQLSEPIQGKLFWYFLPGLHNTKIQAPPPIYKNPKRQTHAEEGCFKIQKNDRTRPWTSPLKWEGWWFP